MNGRSATWRSAASALLFTALMAFGSAAAAPTAGDLIASGEYERALEVLDHALKGDPADAGVRYQRARVRGFLGDHPGSLADYAQLLARFPDNVDYVFGRAQALARLGRDGEALDALAEASRLAPEYEDVWRLRYRVQLRQEGAGAQDALAALRAEARRRFPNSTWWREAQGGTEPDERDLSLTLGATVQSLERSGASLPGWDDQFAELAWRRSDRLTLLANLSRARRFAATDTAASVGAEWRIDDDWSAGARIGAAGDADFLAAREFVAHLHRSLPRGWGAGLRLHRREFSTATVTAWTATGERYFGNFRAAYALGLAHLHGADDSIGHSASLSWYADDRSTYGLTLSAGEEAEVVGPGQVLVTDVSAAVITGRHDLGSRYELRWWAGTHEQGDFYRRLYAGMAVRFRF